MVLKKMCKEQCKVVIGVRPETKGRWLMPHYGYLMLCAMYMDKKLYLHRLSPPS